MFDRHDPSAPKKDIIPMKTNSVDLHSLSVHDRLTRTKWKVPCLNVLVAMDTGRLVGVVRKWKKFQIVIKIDDLRNLAGFQ